MRRLEKLAAISIAMTLAWTASGLEAGRLGGEPLRIDVTNATTASYHVNNRNTRAADVTRVADDNWGLFYNRLNTQLSWKSWQAGLRLDGAWFYTSPDPTSLSLRLLRRRGGGRLPTAYGPDDADYFLLKVDQASQELSTRYINWIYPAKYYVGYTTPDVEATLGDFYAQLGRGFVLSVRKLDELSSDTTVRGGRVTGRVRSGDFRLKLTGLGGEMNPLRIDGASGRFLGVSPSVVSGFAHGSEAGMPRTIDDAFGRPVMPTYAPDHVVGAQIEGGIKQVQVGIQGSLLQRKLVDFDGDGIKDSLTPGVVRSAQQIRTGSVSVNVPDFADHGAGYVEVVAQNLDFPSALEDQPGTNLPGTGYGIYTALSLIEDPLSFTFEGKHYRRIFPLTANVDLARAREFGAVQYSAPPTTEAFWVDTEYEGANTCVTGGRARSDLALGQRHSVFAWAGHYLTWSESVTNERCIVAPTNLDQVWDLAVGTEATSSDRKSHANAVVGARFDKTHRWVKEPITGDNTHVFYREVYARYDIVHHLKGPFSLQLQGWHRRRRQTLGGPDTPYFQGSHTTALQWAPRFTFGLGVGYDQNPLFPLTYFNGQVTYKIDSSSNITIFAGQRRGGLRCISGVCRIFPPFEGVRADATIRF